MAYNAFETLMSLYPPSSTVLNNRSWFSQFGVNELVYVNVAENINMFASFVYFSIQVTYTNFYIQSTKYFQLSTQNRPAHICISAMCCSRLLYQD